MKNLQTERLGIHVTPALRAHLETAAAEDGRSLSNQARRVLELWAGERGLDLAAMNGNAGWHAEAGDFGGANSGSHCLEQALKTWHDRDDPNRNKKKVGGIGREQLNAAVRAVQVKDEPKPAKPVAKPAKWVDEL